MNQGTSLNGPLIDYQEYGGRVNIFHTY